ncbi:MAG: (d)CMP kinase [Chlamydiales bacterium]|nr:(d)CMP kinase [Chlamydiales bacterium]
MIITIDGPVATGKSTIARRLAESLGFIYFDTGAMYRALTYQILKEGIDINDSAAMEAFLQKLDLDIRIRRNGKAYCINGADVTNEIRSLTVTSAVSRVAAIPAIREKLVAIQRQLAEGVNAVFEGRDMGTVVFPDADLKIFLEGRLDVRGQRRLDELKRTRPEEAKDLTLEQCMKEINDRDEFDSKRAVAPLVKAKDAFSVDTSDMSVDEVVFQIFECKDQVKSKKKQAEASQTSDAT